MSEHPTNSATAQLVWVEDIAGRPQVRWRRLIACGLLIVGFNAAAAALVSWFAQTPLRPQIILAFCAGMFAVLSIAVEQQRQRILTGRWRFRLSLQACLLATFFAALFFAGAGNAYRSDLRGIALNERLRGELESVINGGQVSIGQPGGRRIACHVTRPDFSDDDLAEVIRRASSANGSCELTMLFLEGTQTTEAGVCQLDVCSKLAVLSLPSMPLNDRAVAALASLSRLELLMFDDKNLTPQQLATLRQALPTVRLNGKTWSQRDAAR